MNKCSFQGVEQSRRSYHDSMGEVAIGLRLQTHSVELSRHITLWGGLIQSRLPDTSHFSGNEEGQDALHREENMSTCQASFNKNAPSPNICCKL